MSSVIRLGKGRTHILSNLSYVKAPFKNFTRGLKFRSCQTETCSKCCLVKRIFNCYGLE